MKKSNLTRYFLIVLMLFIAIQGGVGLIDKESPKKEKPYSPLFLNWSADLHGLLVLEATARRIDILDPVTGMVRKGPVFENPPTGMALTEEELFVSTDFGIGHIYVFDLKTLTEKRHFAAGPGARSPVYIPSQNALAVCHTWLDEVGIYSLPKGNLISTIPLLRQPYISVLSKDQKFLFVANFITHQAADQDTVSTAVSVINLETYELEKHLLLSNGSNALRGMALSSDGEYVLISHNLGRFQVPTTQLEQGWMNTSALSVLKVSTLSYEGTVLLDEPEYGAAGSWGVASYDGFMVVAHSGTHDISLIPEKAFFNKLASTKNRESLSYDLSFLNGIRKRIKIPGNGPRAISLDEAGLYVGMYFSDTINQIAYPAGNSIIESFPLNAGFVESQERLGEKYFHDAKYCFQGWQACNGCHPMDARTDGLNWDLLNDGTGNPKNCKSMLMAHHTPPAMITGIREDAEIAVRAGFRYIQFAQVSDKHASAVDAYLSNLKAIPSPFLKRGKLSGSARKGKKIFEALACAYCHPEPYYTDQKMHSFVSPTDTLGEQSWDTPTLIEVWRTGPFMHDGRCAEMKEVFSNELHGIRGDISDSELNDLVEYVLSL
ncbi:MAG: YVTN family beta-propeller repeat-containing protein [Bacteroidetes bacterium]|jgi:hypothetical protein|nr:YVTN family beta-propeller repeat-containing protein [Bacteroidota bacterium]MBT4399403.1 YVTN family beta-propeller repeat-containing protein [Bacteroidota bacterium]MBT4409802.1 YVTN family beta-propeller repeat-containing protein [Bacteroidota bacterium]MBT7094464.1 YVTN family beta-propeller repeat-containing protein [Bacteroidota bacterium]MBT7465693.1 YVTN family beta-propeller repeat-containing protein [Bacteroidota bacterium]